MVEVLESPRELVASLAARVDDDAPERAWLTEVARPVAALLEGRLPRLTELGRLGLHAELAEALATGCRAAKVRAPRVDVPVVMIGGLPRTGTTLLMDALAATGCFRFLEAADAVHPHLALADRAEAARRAAARYDLAAEVSPHLARLQPLNATGPHEDTPLLQAALASYQWDMMLGGVDGLARFLADPAGRGAAYDVWASLVAALAHGSRTPLLLKSPLHFVGYDALFARVPDLHLVHVRRDPEAMLASFLNLRLAAQELFLGPARGDDLADIGRRTLSDLETMLVASRRALGAMPAHVRHTAIEFEELVRDPAGVATRITGVAVPPEAARPTGRWNAGEPQLALADFGLRGAEAAGRLRAAGGEWFFPG